MTQTTGGLRAQLRRSRSVLAVAIVPAVALLVVVAAASITLDIPVRAFLADPLLEAGAHPLTGFVSNLGILMWAAAAGASLVAYLAHRSGAGHEQAEWRRFFAASAALSTILVLDDTFQFHEDLVERVLGRGQTIVLVAYVVLLAAYVWRFRRVLASSDWLILAAAGVCFAASLFVDEIPFFVMMLPGDMVFDPDAPSVEFAAQILEEAPKFIGIALWLAYFVHTSAAALVPRRATADSAPDGVHGA